MNIIIDPLTHSPHLKYLIPNSLYYTLPNNISYPPGHYSIDAFISRYKFDYRSDIVCMDSSSGFQHMFVVMPIISSIEKYQGSSYIGIKTRFLELISKYKPKITGKFIIIDNHDFDYLPQNHLKALGIECDIILKRTYSSLNQPNYSSNTYSYPFTMCTIHDPFMNLFNTPMVHATTTKNNRIIWSGATYDTLEVHEEDSIHEFANRDTLVKTITRKYPSILAKVQVPNHLFVQTLNSYKYVLDLRGNGRLNKRLYEIFTTNSLLLSQRFDIKFPFDEGDRFSEECFFSDDNELYANYMKLEADPALYNRCLENQIYLVKKYFTNKWVWSYIETILTK